MMEALAKTAEMAKTTVESSLGTEIDPDARIEARDAGNMEKLGDEIDPDARIEARDAGNMAKLDDEIDPDARIGDGGDSGNTEMVNNNQDGISHPEIASIDTRQRIIDALNNMTDRINQFLDGDGDWITDTERESFVKLLHEARPDYPPWIDDDPDPEWTRAYNRAKNAFKRLCADEGSDIESNLYGSGDDDSEYHDF